MSVKFILPFAAMAFAASTANASIIDLNAPGLDNGEIITNQIAGVTVTATSNGGGTGNDFAIIIDSGNSGSGANGDADLAANFDDPSTGVMEDLDPGNLLAVAEGDCAGGFCRVDDNASGGTINFLFNRDVVFNSVDVFDLATNQLTIILRDVSDAVVLTLTGPTFNTDTDDNSQMPNQYTTIDLGGVTFRTAQFVFNGSGAIGNIDVSEVPLPAGFVFLLTGLAGLGASRRKSAA